MTPSLIVNVLDVIVEGSIASLNVAVMTELTGTPVAPLAGLVDETAGIEKSGIVPLPICP